MFLLDDRYDNVLIMNIFLLCPLNQLEKVEVKNVVDFPLETSQNTFDRPQLCRDY